MNYTKSGDVKGGMTDGSMINMHKQMAMGGNPKTSRTAKSSASKRSSMMVAQPGKGATATVGNLVSH